MSKIYAGQTDFMLKLNLANYGLLTDTTIVLKVQYPNSTIVEVLTPDFTLNGSVLEWQPSVDVPLSVGFMKFWVTITKAGKTIPSEPVEIKIYTEGT